MTSLLDRRNVLLLPAVTAVTVSAAYAAPCQTVDDPGRHFDSHWGSWRAHHRRLRERLAHSTEWEEFDGTCTVWPVMDGAGNISDNLFNMPGRPYRGVTVRSYSAETRTWALWWLDGRFPDRIETPLIGGFQNGVGAFFANDTLRGQPIRVRYIWSQITGTTRRWEQAFSPDSGQTWETNWVTDFVRT